MAGQLPRPPLGSRHHSAVRRRAALRPTRADATRLRSIRRALKPDGRYVLLEIHASEELEDNLGPLGTFLYGFSTLHCRQVSLAYGGAGLGTCGMHEPNVRRLCAEAGFADVRRAGPDHPINALFEVIP